MSRRTRAQIELVTAERDTRALALRAELKTYDAIARELGISGAAAHACVRRAIARRQMENADIVRAIELEKLDAYERVAVEVLRRRHIVVDHGKIIFEPGFEGDIERAFLDSGPILAAIDRLLKIVKQRADLTGIQAPKRVEVSYVSETQIETELHRLAMEVGVPIEEVEAMVRRQADVLEKARKVVDP